MRHPRAAIALTVFLLGCIVVDVNVLRQTSPAVVKAEEHGTSVDLKYQPGYSTWGPTDVYGTAVLWPQEGVATLAVHLMPRLEGGDRYVWWVVNTKSGAALRLGTFNTSNAGDTFLDTFIAHSLPAHANAVVVTVASATDPLSTPAASRSLYGVLPPLLINNAATTVSSASLPGDGSATTSREGAGSGTESSSPVSRAPLSPTQLPRILPMTGGAATLPWHRQ